ncbi:cilia- and flagella-associated protein 45 [Elgaria multicarinata webbii]|uniref:cilia- and flagella-associated protein 45 n=1 Tax=Elgaria multicarinata webbii TaxID=159646 RepID=UPI002FCD3FF6
MEWEPEKHAGLWGFPVHKGETASFGELGSAADAYGSPWETAAPGSVCSLGAASNTSSTRSRSHSHARYRTRAANSEVDESLFGIAKKVHLSRSGSPIVILQDVASAAGKPLGWGHKPETIRLITRDLIRDLVVPTEDPSGESLIISPQDFARIKDASRVLTKEERESQQATLRAEREAVIAAVNERKKSMKLKEILRKKNEKLNDLEQEAKERAQYLLERAANLRIEQEDEIKSLGEIMLEAKCHAIRDAQILEKKQIEKELEEEEMRLARMMEVERQKANKMQDELEQKRKQELFWGRRHIIEQIEKNQELRAMKAEQRDQEAQEMLDYLERLQFEDEREMERRRLERLRIQAEIKHINDENQKRKAETLAQEKMADMRVLEYQRKKMAREAEFEAEQEKIRREKEMETARLRALQEKAQDYQAEQDALRAKRNQEATEREWRRKEKDAAQKKAQTEAMLKQSRLEQVAQKEHSLAIQVQRERAEFERIVRIQREQIEKERKEHERRVALQQTHADEIRRQVREHQQKQIQERIAIFEEGKRLKEEVRRRSERINEIKQKKLDELRAAGLPEKYCSQVERKAFIQPTPVH